MPADKKENKVTKAAPKCKCGKKCDCNSCNQASQVPFYLLLAMLVTTFTVLVISVGFNISVRDIFRPDTYIYNGKFDKEIAEGKRDENGLEVISAGAAIDMTKNKEGFLIVCEENDIACDAFARRVASYVEGDTGIYRYNIKADEDTDDFRAESILGVDDTPSFLYIKNGIVYDRLDAVKDDINLAIFLEKYLPSVDTEE
ncbi:MAG: hypothetical protein MJ154_03545 [Candidatus Saccharibacteria bacterium]|nr:hypothetical protein [Candidatus Saccharibacteria bacterium]